MDTTSASILLQVGREPLLQEAITVPVYGDTAHLRGTLRPARPPNEQERRHAHQSWISLRIILWIQKLGSRFHVRLLLF